MKNPPNVTVYHYGSALHFQNADCVRSGVVLSIYRDGEKIAEFVGNFGYEFTN